jgi:hypothetical protein
MAEREFFLANPLSVDAVLKSHWVDTVAKLHRVPPQELGLWLGASGWCPAGDSQLTRDWFQRAMEVRSSAPKVHDSPSRP